VTRASSWPGLPPAPTVAPVDIASLVGRDREIAELRQALAQAGRGGTVALVCGEAGSGKTAIADALAGYARAAGVRVAWGACHESDGGAPYEPWLAVLHALGQSAADLGRLFSGERAGRFQLFAEVATIVRGAAPGAGLLVVLDDLHWADTGSLLLLQALAGGVDDVPVMFLGLFRDPGIRTEPAALLRAIGRERIARTMTLAGLGPADAAALAGSSAGHPLPEATAAAIVERAGGNPLFIRELTRLTGPSSAAGALPGSIREVIGQRIAQLPGPAATVLRHAAIGGREFTAPLVAAISDRDTGDVLDALGAAAAASLVTFSGGVFRFAHVLTQEVLYAEVPPARRPRLHARLAEALASSGAADVVAHHLREAVPVLGAGPAVRATLDAARQADRQLAYEHAAGQYRAALGLMDETGAAERAAVLLDLARCQARAGAVDHAWASCQAAAGIARATGAPDVLADAATVLRGLPDSATAPQINALCREALAGLPASDAVRTARVLAQLALTTDRFGAREPGLSQRALVAAEACGEPFALSLALHARYLELRNIEFVLERLSLGERAIRLGREAADEDTVCWGHWWRLAAFTELGRAAELSAELAAFAGAAEHLREPVWMWRLGMARAAQAAFAGRYELARSLAERAAIVARRGGNDAADFVGLVMRSHLALQTGAGLDETETVVREFVAHGPFLARSWLAVVVATAGRHDESAALWSSVVPHLTSFPRHSEEWMASAAGNSMLCTRFDDQAAAPVLYGLLRPYAGRWLTGDPCFPNEGPVSLYLGMLATVQRDWATAYGHLTSALAACQALGSEPYEAMARYQLGRLLHARRGPGDAREAGEHLDTALRMARRLGMAPLAGMAAQAGQASRPALSPREEQVAALVAEGLSNRQIATRLKMSERTAENHVTHILTKLDFSSRARIAAWYAARPGD
jgi:DNA-binding CsgD family transcriptional regulator